MARKIEVQIVGDSRSFERALGRAGGSASTFGRAARRALLAGGVAAATGLGLAVKSAIDFESSFAGVRKTVEATPAQFKALEQGIRNMAKEIPASTTELNKIAESAGQLGIKREAILGFTRVVADLGETTNLVGEEAASSLARIANVMGTSQKQFDRLGSTIVALGNAGASTESEIVEMGLRIAGAGKQAGLSEADVLGFANALSSVGIEAQAGGTAISRVMIDIAKAVRSGGDELDDFARVAGMSSRDFKRAFEQDAAGAIVTFIEGLGKIGKEGGNVFKILDDLGLSEIRVRDALLRAAGAGDLFRESLELGSKAWKDNTALTEEARKRYETTAAQVDILKNNVNDFAITAGQRLLPMLNRAIQGSTKFVNEYGDEVMGVAQAITTGLGGAISGSLATMALFTAAMSKAVGGLKALRLALLTVNPLFAAASLAVGVLAFAFIRGRQESLSFADATKKARDAVQSLVPAANAAKQADLDLAAARNNVKLANIAVKDAETQLADARKRGQPREVNRAEANLQAARISARQAALNLTTAEEAQAKAKRKVASATRGAEQAAKNMSAEVKRLSDDWIKARSPLNAGAILMKRQNEEARKKHVREFAQQATQLAREAGKAASQLEKTNPRLAATARNAQRAASTMSALASAWGRVVDLPTLKEFTARARIITTVEEHRIGLFTNRRQHGGPVAARTPYIVGERGPELFVPRSAGTVVPNSRLRGAGGGGSWGRPIQVNVQLGRKTLGSVIVDLDEEYRQQNGGRSLLGG